MKRFVAASVLVIVGCKSRESVPAPTASATATSTSIATSTSTSIATSTATATATAGTDASVVITIPKWADARHAASADGSFSVTYPSKVFTKTSALGDSVALKSDISENDGMQGTFTFGIKVTKLRGTKAEAMKHALQPETFAQTFSDGTDKSFAPIPDFVDAETGANGANGYRIAMGVEGVGDVIRVFTTFDGANWRIDCNYCCGLVPAPKMTSDRQLEICEDVVHAFQSAH